MTDTQATEQKSLTVAANVLASARGGDELALNAMFKQFVGNEETVQEAYYLGKDGIWGFGRQSFAAVTDRKLASIKVGWFGEMIYQDGYIEDIESGAIIQPSLLGLYIMAILLTIGTFGIGLLLLPFLARLYYRFNKSGLIATVDVGIPVYIFSNRSKLTLVNRIWRRVHTQKLANK